MPRTQKQRESQRRYYLRHQEYIKKQTEKRRRERLYGLTEDDYNQLLIQQSGVCAICRCHNVDESILSVDHDHQTGQARALLCRKCNSALGMADDDPGRLRLMAEYLEQHASSRTADY